MFLGTRPASGTRIGTATWPYNALLVEVQPLTPWKFTWRKLAAVSDRMAGKAGRNALDYGRQLVASLNTMGLP